MILPAWHAAENATYVLYTIGGLAGSTPEMRKDVAIDVTKLDARWSQALVALGRALQGQPDLAAFVAALRTLGPPLGQALPHAADDVNELPDEMSSD